MSFGRDRDAIRRDLTETAEPGRHDVTLTKIEVTRKSGHPQIVFTETIDNGDGVGTELKEFFLFNGQFAEEIAWARLANIMDKATYEENGKTVQGFAFESASSAEAFAMQFPKGELRWNTEVEHMFKVEAWIDVDNAYKYTQFTPEQTDETPYKHWIKVQEHEFEEWEGEKKGPYAIVRDGLDVHNIYDVPQNEPSLTFEDEDEDDVEKFFEEKAEEPLF